MPYERTRLNLPADKWGKHRSGPGNRNESPLMGIVDAGWPDNKAGLRILKGVTPASQGIESRIG